MPDLSMPDLKRQLETIRHRIVKAEIRGSMLSGKIGLSLRSRIVAVYAGIRLAYPRQLELGG